MNAPHLDDHDVPAVTYDLNDDGVVVIVGSGAGGGTIADELTRRGIDVVVLEAGPRFKMDDIVNDEWAMYDRLTWKDARACTGASPIARDYPTAPTWTCKGLGGTTLHWAAMCPRGLPHDFRDPLDLRRRRWRGRGRLAVRLRGDRAFLPRGREQDGRQRAGQHPAAPGLQQLPGHGAGREAHGLHRLRPQQRGDQRGAPRWPQRLRSDRLLHAGLPLRRQVVHLRLRAAARRGHRRIARFARAAWRSASSTTTGGRASGVLYADAAGRTICRRRGWSAWRRTRSRPRGCCSTRNRASGPTAWPTARAWSASTTCVTRDRLHVRRVPAARAHVPRHGRLRPHSRRGAARPLARLRRRLPVSAPSASACPSSRPSSALGAGAATTRAGSRPTSAWPASS